MTPGAPAERRPIRLLSAATVEQIAAGEVVERPASVVKELVENALDAGAHRISVRLEGGGVDLVEVSDDGTGIPAAELELALARHATSKLAPDGVLERVGSLGFRGEALAAIASVARLRLLSRTADAEVAEGVEVSAGGPVRRFAAPRGPGTSVEVRDLFFNTPARRKFLKAPAAELVEALRTVERSYLARPDVSFRVDAGGREVTVLPAVGHLAEAVSEVLGAEVGAEGTVVEGTVPGGTVHGVLGPAGSAGTTSTGLYFAVNGRPVVSRSLAQSVRVAFGDRLPRTRFPVGVIHLELSLDRLDVNVHPTKREVRFLKERDLAEGLRQRVREALVQPSALREPPVRDDLASLPLALLPATRVRPLAGWLGREPARAEGPGQLRLDSAEGPRPLGPSTPVSTGPERLDLLGPVESLYWVAATGDGVVLIDQHAASERYLFDTLRSGAAAARQTLVAPLVLELPAGERAAWEAHRDEVRAAGFEVELFGPRALRVLSVPVFLRRRATAETLRELLRELAEGGRATQPDAAADRITATIACHAAIRAGDVVETEAFATLLGHLARLATPAVSCPHGRPIMVHLSRNRLDRWFLRQGA